MAKKVQFVFEFEGRKPDEVTRINRQLFDHKDHSWYGKYTYERKGLLSDYNIERIAKGVFLADVKHEDQILDVLQKAGTKKVKRYYISVDKVLE